MDYKMLKKSAENIKLSDQARARIIKSCQSKILHDTEEITMNNNKTGNLFKKPIAAAAVIALCLCFALAASAAGYFGFFSDITDNGAVVGTHYEQASDEIGVSITVSEGEITLRAEFVNPDAIPYRELEALGIESYRIVDMLGNTVAEGTRTELFAIFNGAAEISIPSANLSDGEYRLIINSFVGSKKADQPLVIGGGWECGFTI